MEKIFNGKVNYGSHFSGKRAYDCTITLNKGKDGKISIVRVYFEGKTKEGKVYDAYHDVNPIDDYTKKIIDFNRDTNHPQKFVYNYRVESNYDENGICTDWTPMSVWVDTTKPVAIKSESEIKF